MTSRPEKVGAPFVYQAIEQTGAANLDDRAPIEEPMHKVGTVGLSDFRQLLRALAGLHREVGEEVFNFENGAAS